MFKSRSIDRERASSFYGEMEMERKTEKETEKEREDDEEMRNEEVCMRRGGGGGGGGVGGVERSWTSQRWMKTRLRS